MGQPEFQIGFDLTALIVLTIAVAGFTALAWLIHRDAQKTRHVAHEDEWEELP
jgi:hypothetical protein